MTQLSQSSDMYLLQQLKNMQKQIDALATQAQYQVANSANGNTIIDLGVFPGTPVKYGLMLYNASGQPVIMLGKQADGTFGLELFDASGDTILEVGELIGGTYGLELYDSGGNPIIQLGPNGSGQYGLYINDSSGNLRAELGLLMNGDYGVLVNDPVANVFTEILPTYWNAVATAQATSSTSYTDLATAGPSIPAVTIGASGEVIVSASSLIAIPGATGAAQSGGFIGVSINGAAPTGVLDEAVYFSNTVVGTTAVGMAASQAFVGAVTGLTPGAQYSFKMRYKMAGPGTVTFESRYLQVQPI